MHVAYQYARFDLNLYFNFEQAAVWNTRHSHNVFTANNIEKYFLDEFLLLARTSEQTSCASQFQHRTAPRHLTHR